MAAGFKDSAEHLSDRVVHLYEKKELDAALEAAGDRLVVLELMKDTCALFDFCLKVDYTSQ
jgi:hypothetical protein